MEAKPTAVFTECLSNTAPLQASLDVLEPIEKAISNFFDEIEKGKKISPQEIRDFEVILENFNSDNLLSPEKLEPLKRKAESLQGQLIAVDYFSKYYSASPIFAEIMEVYRTLVVLNQTPVHFLNFTDVSALNKKSSPTVSADFIEKAESRLNSIEEIIVPLEKEKVSTTLPRFNSDHDVTTYMKDIRRRVRLVEAFNGMKEELHGLMATALKDRAVELLQRIDALHSQFSHIPGVRLEGVVEPLSQQPTKEFSLKIR